MRGKPLLVSIEDKEGKNDLDLLSKFQKTKVSFTKLLNAE